MEFETIRYDVVDHVLTVTLNRPERLNAFTETMRADLVAAIDAADQDDSVRAVILTGEGRAFCAGADLGEGGKSFEEMLDESPRLDDGTPRDGGGIVTGRMFRSRKPLIAAINGAAVGVGVTMTLPMDFRLASTRAKFGFVFARRGIVPESASSWFLPRVVGIPQAMEWVTTGRVFDADEALRGGLIRSVHEPEDLLSAAQGIAREIVEHTSLVSVALSRRMMWSMLGSNDPMQAHEVDSRAMLLRSRSADVREGVEAFLEKRPANFSDRPGDEVREIERLL